MAASMLTSSEMAAAAISMSSVSSSKAHQSSLPSGKWTGSICSKSCCGEGYSGAVVDSMSSNLPDAVGDVLQTGGDGVAARVHRLGGSG